MKSAIILLHGRGGSAEDILGLREEFGFPDALYFAPEAPGHAWSRSHACSILNRTISAKTLRNSITVCRPARRYGCATDI